MVLVNVGRMLNLRHLTFGFGIRTRRSESGFVGVFFNKIKNSSLQLLYFVQ